MTAELAMTLQACQVLDPDAGSLVGEVWNEGVSADALPVLEAMYQREIRAMAVLDEAAARQHLLDIVSGHTSYLERMIKQHVERAELEAELAPDISAFDSSKEGELLKRYENACEKNRFRNTDELHSAGPRSRSGASPHTGVVSIGLRAVGPARSSGRSPELCVPIWTRKMRQQTTPAIPKNSKCGTEGVESRGGAVSTLRDEPACELEAEGSEFQTSILSGGPEREAFEAETSTLIGGCVATSEIRDAADHVLRNEPNAAGPMDSDEEEHGGVAPFRLDQTTAPAGNSLVVQPRQLFLGRARLHGGHGNVVAGSRRERRRRNREERRSKRDA